ncbi:MAG: hypothetical protein ACRYFX_14915 [Janthinobacterium lividum]
MFATLLLQAAPSNVLLGAGLGIIVAIVGWLLNRTIAAFDASVKKTEEAVQVLTKLFTDLHLEVKNGNQLVKYLENRVDTLEHKKETLEKSFAEMDKIIDREIIHKRTTS